jgi:6-phosphofructokinase 1
LQKDLAKYQRVLEVFKAQRIGTIALLEVANGVKKLPRSYMNEAGVHISEEMRRYTGPLLVGQVPVRIGEDGLPEYVRLRRQPIPKKLPAFVGAS